MSLKVIDKHEYFTIEGQGDFLAIKSDDLEKYIDLINSKQIKNIGINFYWGFRIESLNFLRLCPGIEKIYIAGDNYELDVLNYLKRLSYLSTTSDVNNVDFANFRSLTECCISWSKKVQNLDQCVELTHIKIYKYNLSGDLKMLPVFKKLRTLELVSSPINSLEGIEKYTLLENFGGYHLSRLISIAAIATLTELDTVILENCKKIEGFDALAANRKLTKIILTNCGKIPSIKFIKELETLSFFTFMGSDVLDGDMRPCIGLKYFAFNNRRHYSHTESEIRALS